MKKLDLHGEKLASARRKVELFINRNWGCGEEMEIITGHSPTMKRIVTDMLEKYKLKWRVGDHFGLNTGFVRSKFE